MDHYYAFISYSHVDKKEVLSFHKFLEHYRLPEAIRKVKPEAPVKFAPVFIDRDNLSGTKLNDNLKRALEASDFLIVVCSPDSAASSYVNEEVNYFIKLNRAERIIPYIISGTPDTSNSSEECYPPALRAIDPLGADVKDLGKDKARLRVIASMLDVNLDLLYQKEKRRRILHAIIAGAVALIVMISGWNIYSYYKIPKTQYYQDYVEINGIPKGIGTPLTASMREELPESCLITTLAGKVVEVSHVNAEDNPVTPIYRTVKDSSAIREYRYDDNGELVNVALKDENDETLVNWQYSNYGTEISLRDASQNTVSLENFESLINSEDIESLKTDGVCAYKLIYDKESGLLEKKLFTAYAGSQAATPDSNGTYGRGYEYTEDGRIYRVYYLGEDGEREAQQSGALYLEYTYDEKGRIVKTTYYDEEDNRIIGLENLAEVRFEYEGNVISEYGYNAEGDLVELPGMGTVRYDAVYDDNGNLMENRYCDEDGTLRNSVNGYAVCEMEYDEAGHQTKVSYKDENEEPVSAGGYHTRTKEYIENNGNTEVWEKYYDTDDDLIISESGYAVIHRITDVSGNAILREYYDDNENPTAGEEGYFRQETETDDLGQAIRTSYYDTEGELYLCNGTYAIKTMEYDADGQCTDIYYWDAENNLASGPNGYAHIQPSYDLWGKCSEIRYYGTDDQLMPSSNGYAIIKCTYDATGNLSSASFYDTDGNPTISDDEYHMVRWKNENGRITRISYYGMDDEPIAVNGVYKVEIDRDLKGNVTRLSNYGIHSEPVLSAKGYYSYEKTYDDYGNLTSLTYFDTNGNFASGIAATDTVKTEHFYDETGTEILTGSWHWDENRLIERLVWESETKSPILKQYYNTDGTAAEINGIHTVEYFTDENGEFIGANEYDANDNLILSLGNE